MTMLDSKLKTIVRPTLDDNTKARHLKNLISEQQQGQKKHPWGYVATLITFTLLTLLFIQTLQYTPPNEQQQANVLTVGPLKKASYLYSTNAERNYEFPSLFITSEITTMDSVQLQQLQQLLNGLEKMPFTEQLLSDEGATHYILEQTNGEKLYLKSVYREEGSLLIDVTTNQQIAFSKNTASDLEQFWMQLYLERNAFPVWKIVVLLAMIISSFFVFPKYNRERAKREKPFIALSMILFFGFLYSYSQFVDWYGVGNIAVLLLLMICMLIVEFILERIFNRTEQTVKERIISLAYMCLFLFILFV